MLEKELKRQKKVERDELKKVHKPSLSESVIARRNENYPIEAIRLICSHCEAVLNTEEKTGIIYKLERGVSCKVMCKKCIQKFNKKYFEKNAEKLKAQRIDLRDFVNQDKLNHQCDCESSCNVKKTLIYHRKRNTIVSIGTITLKDYKENCQIICAKKVAFQLVESSKGNFVKTETIELTQPNKKSEINEVIEKIKSIDYNDLFDKIEDFQSEMPDWLFEHDIELIENFELYTFQNTESKYKNNIEILLVANKREVKGGDLKKQVVYSSSSFGERNKDEFAINDAQFELRYCMNKFLKEIRAENLFVHYKTYQVPAAFLNEKGEDIRLEVMKPLDILAYNKLKTLTIDTYETLK